MLVVAPREGDHINWISTPQRRRRVIILHTKKATLCTTIHAHEVGDQAAHYVTMAAMGKLGDKFRDCTPPRPEGAQAHFGRIHGHERARR